MRIGPKYKIARRLGEPIFPKTQTSKFALAEERKSRNRGRGKKRRGGRSEYGTQLIEKQKIRYTYGISDRQLSNYVHRAYEGKGSPQTNLFSLLESRLDNTVFRLGFTPSRPFARQLVTHGHILLNGKRVKSPSYSVRPGDVVSIRPGSRASKMFAVLSERLKDIQTPEWLLLDSSELSGKVKEKPVDSTNLSGGFTMAIEFYSRV